MQSGTHPSSQELEALIEALRNDLCLPIRPTLQGLVNQHAALFLDLRRRRVPYLEIILLLQRSSDRFNSLNPRTLSKAISRLKAAGVPLKKDSSRSGAADAAPISLTLSDKRGPQEQPPTAVPATHSTKPELRLSTNRLSRIYQSEDNQ
jgi:hypothetical protein